MNTASQRGSKKRGPAESRRILAASLAVAACGGSALTGKNPTPDGSSDPNVTADASVSFDATASADASVDAVADAGEGDGPVESAEASPDAILAWPPDGGIFLDGSCPYDASWSADGAATEGDAGDAAVPLGHRAAAQCCPLTRDPGLTCDPDAARPPAACFSDSDCTQGTNGRCLALPAFQATGLGIDGCNSWCTYDQCFSDWDCPGHVPCDCRSNQLGANVCVTGSLCAVDSDCGRGGYCTLSVRAYYCHRPGDVCFGDSDCPSTEFGSHCTFQTTASQWACVANPPPPGGPP